MNSGVYSITSESGKIYIGSTKNFAKRWAAHLLTMRNGEHINPMLQAAFLKYGEASLKFRKLIVCSEDDLLFYEQRFIDFLLPEYNISSVAGSPMKGRKHSTETREKFSIMRTGRKCPKSPETREKIAQTLKGRKPPLLAVQRAIEKNTGRVVSEETRAKLSSAHKGKPKTEEHKAKLRKPKSEEHKAKLRKPKSPEHIAKIAEAIKNRQAKRKAALQEIQPGLF